MSESKTVPCVSFFLVLTLAACGGSASQTSSASGEPSAVETVDASTAVIDHTVESLTGETVELASFRGRPMLIVNTASKCGYTPQYESLQKLHERYGEQGLVVIGFPSNDFGNQDQAPVYKALTAESGKEFQGEIKWNFTKFLVDSEGHVIARFESSVDPLDDQVISAVEAQLAENVPTS